MGAKVWGTAAVVIAAAAAAGAGIITWEGRVWDEHAQDLASYKEAPVKTVIFTETARTWPELRDACSLKQGQFRQYLYQSRDLI